jgi:hypothetical protein
MLRHPGTCTLILDGQTAASGGTYRSPADLALIAKNALLAFGRDQLLCTSRPIALCGAWKGVRLDAGLHTAGDLLAVTTPEGVHA